MKYRIKPTERNNQQCERSIEGTYQGVVVVCHESEPYAVPMNHAYEDDVFTMAYSDTSLRSEATDPLDQYHELLTEQANQYFDSVLEEY